MFRRGNNLSRGPILIIVVRDLGIRRWNIPASHWTYCEGVATNLLWVKLAVVYAARLLCAIIFYSSSYLFTVFHVIYSRLNGFPLHSVFIKYKTIRMKFVNDFRFCRLFSFITRYLWMSLSCVLNQILNSFGRTLS